MFETENTYDLETLLEWLGEQVVGVSGPRDRRVSHPAPITEASDAAAITFCSRTEEAGRALVRDTRAGVILCDESVGSGEGGAGDRTLVAVRDPRLSFLRLVGRFFARKPVPGVHPMAVIDPAAVVHPTATVDALARLGACEVGEGSRIGSHVEVGDGVRIGRNVIVGSGAVLGADGFGYQRNEAGVLEKFPHVGGIVIEDDVEIGANTCIDRGTLGDTIVRQGAKIDNFVHVAHNVVIGRHAAVIAHAMIGGSTRIGERAWIAPSACIRDGLTIGDDATVGLGAVVIRDVPAGETVMGSPAREAEEYKRLLRRLREG